MVDLFLSVDNQAMQPSRGSHVFCGVTWRDGMGMGWDRDGGRCEGGKGLTYSESLSIILLILHEPYCDGNTAALHPSRPRTRPFLRRLALCLVRQRVLKEFYEGEVAMSCTQPRSDSLTNGHH